MPVSQFCWEEGKTWENGYYLLSAVAEAIFLLWQNLARTYVQLPLPQWGAGNVYLLVLSSWKVNIAENPIVVMFVCLFVYSRRCFGMEGALTLIFWKSETIRDIKK